MQIPANFSVGAYRALEAARDEARNLGRGHVGTEHLLLSLSNREDSIGAAYLRRSGLEIDRLRRSVGAIRGRNNGARVHVRAAGRRVGYSQLLQRVIVQAGVESRAFNHSHIGVDHLWLALLRPEGSTVRRILNSLKVDPELVRSGVLSELRPVRPLAAGACDAASRPVYGELPPPSFPSEAGSPADPAQHVAQQPSAQPGRAGARQPSLLEVFGRDLTELARAGKLHAAVGRDEVIDRICDILCLHRKNNAAIVGEAGVGKTAIVEGLAYRIAKGDVPEALRNRVVIELTPSGLVSGTKYRGEFEGRMRALLDEIRRRPELIIFFDEMHMLIGAGRAEGSADAANILKPALSRDGIKCIGATTVSEYRRLIEKDEALDRRFHQVLIEEPSVEETITILKGIRPRHEAHHGTQITDAAIEAAAKLTNRFIKDRHLPDKAIDALDEAGVLARRTSERGSEEVQALDREIQAIRVRIGEALVAREPTLAGELRQQELRLVDRHKLARAASASARPVVTEQLVASVVSAKTKIPVGHISAQDGARLLNIADEFRKVIIGQDFACRAAAKGLRRARGGIRDPRRPSGAMMFLGPTGVGKTELAKQLAKEFSGDASALLALDMSEFMEKHSVANLIGGPQSYVGYEDGGRLVNAVRRRPYSLILVDEVEKAAPEVLQIFLQILEEGRLTDSSGRVADFSNTLLVFTTNVGANTLLNAPRTLGFGARQFAETDEDYEKLKERGLEELRKSFKPELLNRMTDLVVFRPLGQEDFGKILDLQMNLHAAMALEQRQIRLMFEEGVRGFVFATIQDRKYGAREVRRAVEELIMDGLSNALLSGQVHAGDTVIAAVEGGVVAFRRVAPEAPARRASLPGAAAHA